MLKKTVILSFIATLLWTVITVISISQIDSSLAPYGSGFAAILVLGAVLFGLIDPDSSLDRLPAKLALSWVSAASRNKWRAIMHTALMICISIGVYFVGLGSVHSHIGCSEIARAGMKCSWRNWLGHEIEAACSDDQLTSVWTPLSNGRDIRVQTTKDGVVTGKCALSDHNLMCDWLPRTNSKDGLPYTWIKPGTFEMGCSEKDIKDCPDEELPRHEVKINRGFWMGETEVTVGAYKRFLKERPENRVPEKDEFGREANTISFSQTPVVEVTWQNASDYCNWAGDGLLKLPTEAQWEYAAKAGSEGERYKDNADDIAWFAENAGNHVFDTGVALSGQEDKEKSAKAWVEVLRENDNRPHEVAGKQPNAWRLYDMLGNVWEWVDDWYKDDYYKINPDKGWTDPKGPNEANSTQFAIVKDGSQVKTHFKILRGGSWDWPKANIRVSQRYSRYSEWRYGSVGFRCAGMLR